MTRARLLPALAVCLFTLGAQAGEAWRDGLDRAASLGRTGGAFHRDGNEADAEKSLRDGIKALPAQVPQAARDDFRRISVELYRQLADVQQITGRMAEARASLQQARLSAQGDAGAEADVDNDLGLLDWQRGRLDEAERQLTKALAVYEARKAEHMRAVVLGNLGLIALDRFSQGGPPALLDGAEQRFTQARDVFIKEGAKDDIANQWSNLGLVYRHQKKYVLAAKAHQQGLKLDRDTGNRIGEVDSIGNLGRVAEEAGDVWKARDHYRQAFTLAQKIGYARGIAHHGLYLMVLLNRQHRAAEAEPYGPPALKAAEALGKDFTLAGIQEQMARTARTRCSPDKARRLAAEARAHYAAAAMADEAERMDDFLGALAISADGGCHP